MLLWDYEMSSARGVLEGTSPAKRLALAVSAIEWTINTMTPPIETDQVRGYLSVVVDACRQAVQAGNTWVSLSDEMLDSYDEVDEIAEEPGTSHMLSAVLACCDPTEDLSAERAYGILSFCYEGSLDREGVEEWTLEAERANSRCRAVIDYQKSLIATVE
ncbi:hypothetical protein GAR06_05222 [Micromonospora saelicesensis]|uniref:DUF4259 domain-containing protein n=2 Tax=Micromonospora saelicesensis TaxID=285676 RepID=A0A1C4X169_9ACTN|nr:hypothetical protein GAR06_05222 [Micromonospora saelicesensis]RAO49126.1 hypothetical protein PSN01_04662 [Micromonospora saelicesensis]RAO59531.1 hypothetical protein LUPAC06_01673 [Micromonospora saelicesensis]SCF02200.1 hypothetical protein GA0070561_3012 [Micromonospora saelicesensis]